MSNPVALRVIPLKRAPGVPATGCWVCRKSSLETGQPVCKKGHESDKTCGEFRDARNTSEVIPAGKVQR